MGYNQRKTRLSRAGAVSSGVSAAVLSRMMKRTKISPNLRKRQGGRRKVRINAYPKVGTGGTYSTFYRKHRASKRSRTMKLIGALNAYNINSAGVLTASIGTQASGTLASAFGLTDLNTCFNNINPSGAGFLTTHALFTSASLKHTITNDENTNIFVDIYDIVARKDVSASATNAATPDLAFYQGLVDENNASQYTNIGSTPFRSALFTQFYKVHKITHCCLATGQSHQHRVSWSPNRVVNREEANYSTGNIGGLTYYTMVVIKGGPVDALSASSTVSTAYAKISYTTEVEYRYTFISDSKTNYFASNTLPTTLTGGANVMNSASGVVIPEAGT